MKKFTSILFIIFLLVLFVTGCNRNNEEANNVYEIRENMFITQIDDINLNFREYLGRTIKLEGLFKHTHWEDNNWYFVFRNAPGCCGDDGEVGFEVSWSPDYFEPDPEQRGFPNANEWVEAIGELRSYDFLGISFLYIALSELNVLEARGLEFVTR